MGHYNVSQVSDFLYTICQCAHCGDWLNDRGFVDLSRKGTKIKTSQNKFCKHCRTKPMRDKMDEENEKLFKKHGCKF